MKKKKSTQLLTCSNGDRRLKKIIRNCPLETSYPLVWKDRRPSSSEVHQCHCVSAIAQSRKSLETCRTRGKVEAFITASGKAGVDQKTPESHRRSLQMAWWRLWCCGAVWPSNLLRSWSIWRPEPHYPIRSIRRPALTFTAWILHYC